MEAKVIDEKFSFSVANLDKAFQSALKSAF